MQTVKVSVLYKKGNKNDMGNCRPVFILPTLSEGLEKVVLVHLVKFSQKHYLLTHSQFGFRKNTSTEFALLELKEFVLENLEEKKACIVHIHRLIHKEI